MSARTPGKFGRLSAKMPVGLRDLTYYAAGPLPKAPASVAVPGVADWGRGFGEKSRDPCIEPGLWRVKLSV